MSSSSMRPFAAGWVLAGLGLFGTVAPVAAHEHFYGVVLTGAGLSAAAATGTALITLDLDVVTARIEATFSGLAGGSVGMQMHCCTAAAGSGTALGAMANTLPAGFPTGLTSASFDVTYDLTADATYNTAFISASGGHTIDGLNALINGAEAGTMYLTIRSSAFPNGEIRGFLIEQLAPVPEPASYALMFGGLLTLGALARRRRSI